MQTSKNQFGKQTINDLQTRLKHNVSDRHFASAEIHQNDAQTVYNEQAAHAQHQELNEHHFLSSNQRIRNADAEKITNDLEYSKNVIKGSALLIWRQIVKFWQILKNFYTYNMLRLERIRLFDTSLRNVLNTGFIALFIILALILYRNGQVTQIKAVIIEKVGQWSGAAGINVQEVKLFNRQHSSKQEILTALNVEVGTPLLSFDVDGARRRIEKIGWIAEAQVQRIMPDKLEISIIEREPFAIWQIAGKHVLVDRNGILVSDQVLNGYHLLPLIVGKGAATEALGLLSALEERPDIFEHIRALVRVGERRWDVDFKNGIRVMLPKDKPEAMLADLERMILDHNIFEKGIKVIDFRLADRVRFEMDDETAKAYFEAKEAAKKVSKKN